MHPGHISPHIDSPLVSASGQRIHITGGPGSGKSRFARRLSDARSIELHDLDGLLLSIRWDIARAESSSVATELAATEAWVSDGVYVGWARPFLDRADLIVWLDVPWHVASYRIFARHVSAELKRNNRFPGWRRWYSFWRWAARFYADRNLPTINEYGAPNSRIALKNELLPYTDKVIVCETSRSAADVFARLTGELLALRET